MQGDKKSLLGSLLPLVQITVSRLNDIITAQSRLFPRAPATRVTFRAQLCMWAITHTKRRFAGVINRAMVMKAAALHPALKLSCFNNHDATITAKSLDDELQLLCEDETTTTPCSDPDPGVGADRQTPPATDSFDINAYLMCVNSDAQSQSLSTLSQSQQNPVERRKREATLALSAFHSGRREVKEAEAVRNMNGDLLKLVIKYNTPMPSSASVERLFSRGRRVLHYLRGNLSDAGLEATMSVNVNGTRGEYVVVDSSSPPSSI